MGQSVLAVDKKPLTKEESAKVIEAAIRRAVNKPTGELTKTDWPITTAHIKRSCFMALRLTIGPPQGKGGITEIT